jgi:hypothetical protein
VQQRGQLGRDRLGPSPAALAVLELPPVALRPVVGPVGTGAGRGLVEVEHPQPVSGRDRLCVRTFAASSSRSAEKYISAKNATRRGPDRRVCRTALSSTRACTGFTTDRRSISPDAFGAFHFTDGRLHHTPDDYRRLSRRRGLGRNDEDIFSVETAQ